MPSLPFIGEIMPWAGNFAPVGWLACDGQLLPIAQYDVLFNLIGTTYGGDGQSTFAVPDLRGRGSVHAGNGYVIGQIGGVESVTMTANQLPAHSHGVSETPNAATSVPVPNSMIPAATVGPELPYGSPAVAPGTMAAGMIGATGSGGSHENRQPHLAIFFCIAVEGIFPSPT